MQHAVQAVEFMAQGAEYPVPEPHGFEHACAHRGNRQPAHPGSRQGARTGAKFRIADRIQPDDVLGQLKAADFLVAVGGHHIGFQRTAAHQIQVFGPIADAVQVLTLVEHAAAHPGGLRLCGRHAFDQQTAETAALTRTIGAGCGGGHGGLRETG